MITKFQHTKIKITDDTLLYVILYKQALLKNIVDILHKYNIRYFLSNGNLLEHTRSALIKHDDDVDIRIYDKDFPIWMKYCKTLKKQGNSYINDENTLLFDERGHNAKKQYYNGIQAILNVSNIPNKHLNKLHSMYSKYFNNKIHIDIVPSNSVIHKTWKNQSYVFKDKLRKILYLNVEVLAPSEKMTHIALTHCYGSNYMIPH